MDRIIPTGVGSRPSTMCSRHSDHRSTRSAGPRSHGITIRHTLLSSQETDARTTRPGTFVPIGCDPALSGLALFFFCSCLASLQILADPQRSSQFLAVLLPAGFFAFRISDLSRSFLRPALPPGLRPRLGTSVPLRCSRTVSVLVSLSKSAVRRPFREEISKLPTPADHDAADANRPREREDDDDLTFGVVCR